jgi:hypothetical protein
MQPNPNGILSRHSTEARDRTPLGFGWLLSLLWMSGGALRDPRL